MDNGETSSNALVSALLREEDRRIKTAFEQLLKGGKHYLPC